MPLFERAASPDHSAGRPTWFRPTGLYRLYELGRARLGGPPLNLFRTLPDDAVVPAGVEALVVQLFERALARLRTGQGDGPPSIAVRVEVESLVDGGDEVVVRVFDNGPVADPPGIPVLETERFGRIVFRREPPAGQWTGIGVLRMAVPRDGAGRPAQRGGAGAAEAPRSGA